MVEALSLLDDMGGKRKIACVDEKSNGLSR
jgi:hypothetical protein